MQSRGTLSMKNYESEKFNRQQAYRWSMTWCIATIGYPEVAQHDAQSRDYPRAQHSFRPGLSLNLGYRWCVTSRSIKGTFLNWVFGTHSLSMESYVFNLGWKKINSTLRYFRGSQRGLDGNTVTTWKFEDMTSKYSKIYSKSPRMIHRVDLWERNIKHQSKDVK